MSRRQPPQRDVAPVAARYRVQYRKTGRMRFTSARDFQRALERAIRRTGIPIAFSAGFSPHPRISYRNSVPTGVSSEAEYLELGLIREVAPDRLAEALDSGLPPGFEVVVVLPAATADFGERLQASRWQIELPDVAIGTAQEAVAALLEMPEALVERVTKRGPTSVDVRAAVAWADVRPGAQSVADGSPCAILQVVVRHVTPSVRPKDLLTALERVAGLPQSQAPRICRLAQGPLLADGAAIGDPLDPDRRAASRP
jgi:radical SAM-linked protein